MQVDRDVNPASVCEQRTLRSSLQQIRLIQSETTQRGKAELRTRYGLRDVPNPMLSLPGDIFR